MTKNLWEYLGVTCLVGLLAGCGPAKIGSINAVPPPTTTVTLSSTSFDFGDNLVGNLLQQTAVTITNTGGISLSLNPTLSGDPSFSIVAAQSCGTQLAAQASCSVVVTYSPTSASAPASQTTTLNLNFANALAGTPSAVDLSGTSFMMTAGTVTATANPQVALYTITPPFAGTVTVSFGTTTSYGFQTWAVPTPIGGGPVSIEVAGMLANTPYHLRASIAFQNGISTNDTDHPFTTTSYPTNLLPRITALTEPEMTPQPGIEMLNPYASVTSYASVVATNLNGQAIWAYVPPESSADSKILAPKQLANGDYVFLFAPLSNIPLNGPVNPADPNLVREVDLVGNTVKQITMAQLNTRLAAANYNLTLQLFSHDVTPLPNGHWLVLANTLKNVVLNGQTNPTQVLGDVIVDLDTNLNPVWVWNSFDHLDVNRKGASFPDWTHGNAIIYSKDDGNILISLRHQSWVLKVNYNNGAGDGSIIWRLGYQGDFQLMNNGADDNDPADWFYGQHGPNFTTSNTSGTFGLTMMDNGNFRVFPNGVCGTESTPPCLYSTVPIFQIDETAKTATLLFHQILPTALYNSFGGNAETLANGDVEYDLCGLAGDTAQVIEVTNQATPQTVWNYTVNSSNAYRGYRLPSLYPGVQW